MHHSSILVAGLLLAWPISGEAAPPPAKPGYQVNLGSAPGGVSYAPLQVPAWVDSTDTTVDPAGHLRPVSPEWPLPMTCVSGCGGGTGGGTTGSGATALDSGAWTDASYVATGTASVPAALVSAPSRNALDVENLSAPGGPVACLNFGSPAAASGAGCAPGSIPIPAGGGRTWDQPGNVSPEAISLVCTAASCPLTIKVR